ncbi:MAG: DNA internalization-related competence protein ComEC/Rec2 [Candidatus Gastranaerophilales bacterium]|nr:DNA internalization-related competence protein ComEC/Rec2 [Candidatus Gastranaerophilales bacterium]
MRRPLFFICLCLVAIGALRYAWGSSSLGEQGAASAGLSDRTSVTVTGEVYQKDTRYLYLKSIVILQTAENLQQNIPITDHFIVERQAWTQEAPIGGRITLRGIYRAFSSASNPGEFDTAAYYRSLQIGGKLAEAELLACSAEYSVLREGLFGLRERWEERLYAIFPEKEASIMGTILLGDKAGLDGEIRELYQRNGIVHILSISGLHITIIGMGFYRLLRRLGISPWLAALCGCGVLFCYGMMTGMGISVCRAMGMYWIRMIAELAGRTYDLLTALGVVGAVMVWSNPGYLTHSGFLLSFGSLMGVGVVYPVLRSDGGEEQVLRYRRYEERRWLRFCKERLRVWGGGLWDSALAGLSIFLATVPVQLWFYYEIPVYSIALNLLVLPFMSVLMIAGLIAMIVPGLGVVGTVDCVILAGYERLCGGFDRLPFHTWNPGRPRLWQIALYYLVLFLFLWAAERKIFSKALKRKRLLRFAVLCGLLGILAFRRQENEIVFLDVGQGDAIVLQTQRGEVYLFDGGSSSRSRTGRYVIEPYLKYCGISHIDAICVSHPDADHCNGILELVQNCASWNITVDRLLLPAVDWSKLMGEGEQDPFSELLCAVSQMSEPVEVEYVQAGDHWQNGEVDILCLHPAAQSGTDGAFLFQPKDANEASECFYIRFDQGSILLTGDIQGEGEEKLTAELIRQGISDVTVLKVAHHGSRNSTPTEFLSLISPEISVISCGRGNRYGHPHAELLERLEQEGTKIFCTAAGGAVTVRFKEESAWVYTFLEN